MNALPATVLLVNPWIYDFAAFDFWNKPLGLLTIGAILEKLGYDVHLIDCLDRFDPDLPALQQFRTDGSGKFHREIIAKPACLQDVPRHYSRYGLPLELVQKKLTLIPAPRVILMTSFMTYWYPAVVEMIGLLRKQFPLATIILGGIYASLCPEHSRRHVPADYVVQGEGEEEAVRLVARLCDGPGRDYHYHHLDELPFPLYGKYPVLHSVPLLTSRGCPFRCTFCASQRLNREYRRRTLDHVLQEAKWLYHTLQVKEVAFFDDALLYQPERHIKPILRQFIQHQFKFGLHTPNGLQLKYIDGEMAELMKTSGLKTIRLSFESTDPAQQQNKVSNEDLVAALHHLEAAGFRRRDVGVYVLMGLPDQEPEKVRRSIDFVHDLGARVNLASFSPIPGTRETELAIRMGFWSPNEDLLLANNTLYPIWRKKYGFALCEEIVNYARLKNAI